MEWQKKAVLQGRNRLTVFNLPKRLILDRERGRGLVTLAPPSEIGPDVVALMHNYSHQTKNYYQDQSGL